MAGNNVAPAMSTLPYDETYPGWAQENKGPTILIVMTILTTVGTLFAAARLYSRRISLGRFAIDDCIVVLCTMIGMAYVALVGVAISYGAGRHAVTLPREKANRAMFWMLVSFVPGILSFVLPKFAVVILLARVLNPGRRHTLVMWIVSTLLLLLTVGLLAITFAQCSPPAAQWGAPGRCWDRMITAKIAITHAIYSAVFDFYLAVYPTIVLSRLQLNWKKKLALSSALGFGYFAGAISCYKCSLLKSLISPEDFTYRTDDVVYWTSIEGNCVLIGACIPTLFPLVKKIFGASALGDSTPNEGGRGQRRTGRNNSNTVVTIGSYPRRTKHPRTVMHLDFLNDEGEYITLETINCSTSELRGEKLAPVVYHQRERASTYTGEPGW